MAGAPSFALKPASATSSGLIPVYLSHKAFRSEYQFIDCGPTVELGFLGAALASCEKILIRRGVFSGQMNASRGIFSVFSIRNFNRNDLAWVEFLRKSNCCGARLPK